MWVRSRRKIYWAYRMKRLVEDRKKKERLHEWLLRLRLAEVSRYITFLFVPVELFRILEFVEPDCIRPAREGSNTLKAQEEVKLSFWH